MTLCDLQKSVPQLQNIGTVSEFFSPPRRSHPSLPFCHEVRSFHLGHVCCLSVRLHSWETCSVWRPPAHSPSLAPPGAGTLEGCQSPLVPRGSLGRPWTGKTMMTSHKGFPNPSCCLLHLWEAIPGITRCCHQFKHACF